MLIWQLDWSFTGDKLRSVLLEVVVECYGNVALGPSLRLALPVMTSIAYHSSNTPRTISVSVAKFISINMHPRPRTRFPQLPSISRKHKRNGNHQNRQASQQRSRALIAKPMVHLRAEERESCACYIADESDAR